MVDLSNVQIYNKPHIFSVYRVIKHAKTLLPEWFLLAGKPIGSVAHCFYDINMSEVCQKTMIKLLLFCDEVANLRFKNHMKILFKALSKVLHVQYVAL